MGNALAKSNQADFGNDALDLLYGDFSETLVKSGDVVDLVTRPRWSRHLLMFALDMDSAVDPADASAVRHAVADGLGRPAKHLKPILKRLGSSPLRRGTYRALVVRIAESAEIVRALIHLTEIDQAQAEVALTLPNELMTARIIKLAERRTRAQTLSSMFQLAVASGRDRRDLANSILAASDWDAIRRTLMRALAPEEFPAAPFRLSDPAIVQIKRTDELVALGHSPFKNCMARRGYATAIEARTLFFKVRTDGEDAMVSTIEDDRFGHRIEQIAGIANAPVSETLHRRIVSAFAMAGVPERESVTDCLTMAWNCYGEDL